MITFPDFDETKVICLGLLFTEIMLEIGLPEIKDIAELDFPIFHLIQNSRYQRLQF